MFVFTAFRLFSLFFLSFILNFVIINGEKTVSVTISNGVINGKTETILDDKQLNVFKGIPYAEPPVGQLRFRKPVPIKRWEQPIDAFEFSSGCIQNPGFLQSIHGINNFSEDCLYLNIWSPIDSQNSDVLKPVMFWIHGGMFILGTASEPSYHGHVLASKGDVLVVSINYRLNTFGFLYTGTADAPGNVGLWDQALALEWVNDNIRYFGGDPEQITIFGESAGSWAVSLHVLSPVSRNLFKNAIMNSGAYIDSLLNGENEDHIQRWLFGAQIIGCADEENEGKFTPKIMDCLRNAKTEELTQIPDFPELKSGSIKLFHSVVIDGQFLPQKPLDMLKNRDFKHNLNLMISTTTDEGSYLLQGVHDYNRYHPNIPQNLTFNEAFNELRRISTNIALNDNINGEEVAKLYFTGLSDDNDFDLLRRTIGIAVGDYYFTCPTIEFAKQVFHYSKDKTNVYQYVYNSKSQEFFLCSKWMGVCHANDIIPMFGHSFLDREKYTERDRQISAQMIEFLTHFAKTGEPVQQNGADWPKYYTIDDNIIAPYYEITYKPKPINNFGIAFKYNECQYLWNKYLQ